MSIDGRILQAAKVAASETYNTAIEHHLTAWLGVRFAERAGRDRSKRPVREIVGVDPGLNRRWSRRRQAVDVRLAQLAADFSRTHPRPPGRVEMLQAQQATLETRDPKHEPRTLTEQRDAWRAEAIEVLGGPERVAAMLHVALNPAVQAAPAVTAEGRAEMAGRVIAALEEHRPTWQYWHLWAETQRQLRGTAIDAADTAAVATSVVDLAIARSIRLTPTDQPPAPSAGLPYGLLRSDGASVFTVAGTDHYTSTRILAAEQRLLNTAEQLGGRALDPGVVDRRLAEGAVSGTVLDAGQIAMIRTLATNHRLVQLVIAPAGAGKTTALEVLAPHLDRRRRPHPRVGPLRRRSGATQRSDRDPGRHPRPTHLGHPAPTTAARLGQGIGPRTLLVIDEAGMADTLTLDTAIAHVVDRCGRVCLVGDDRQLGAVGAGGILKDLEIAHGAVQLTQLHRFTHPAEAAATLQVRHGDPAAIGFYTERDRITIADPTGLPDRLLAGWRHDQHQGLDSLMLAPFRHQVADLNQRARAAQLAGHIPTHQVELADGNQASPGDLVITRRNDRRLASGPGWVRNGDRWTVTGLTADGGIEATHRRTGRPVVLPADYVPEAVELGYATTVHAAQGVSADTTHSLVDGLTTREQLYTMVSRGRTANHLYLAVGDAVGHSDPHRIVHAGTPEPTASEILQRVLDRTRLRASATTIRAAQERVPRLPPKPTFGRPPPTISGHRYDADHRGPAARRTGHRPAASASPTRDGSVCSAEVKIGWSSGSPKEWSVWQPRSATPQDAASSRAATARR